MSKYIIEIAEEYEEYFKGVLICGIADGKFAVDVIAREDLEELNSDYINDIIQCVVLPEGVILEYIKGVTAS